MRKNVNVIVGLQRGDEGKENIASYKYEKTNIVVYTSLKNKETRSVLLNDKKDYLIKMLPKSVLNKDIISVIGPECVMDIRLLVKEINELKNAGIQISPDNLKISDRIPVIMPYNAAEEMCRNVSYGNVEVEIGSKACLADILNGYGVRLYDFFDRERLTNKIAKATSLKPKHLFPRKVPISKIIEGIVSEYITAFENIKDYLCDTACYINNSIRGNKKILVQGPQVFSDSSLDLSSIGISGSNIKEVIGVMKGYCTMVDDGPFPTELKGEKADKMASLGNEYYATANTPKRCGYLDLTSIRQACLTNKITHICLNNIDVVGKMSNDHVKVCCAYGYKGNFITHVPYDSENCEPIYAPFPCGWDITNVTSYSDLPDSCKKFIAAIEQYLEVPVKYIGTSFSDKLIIKD